ncbi:MAG: cyclic pyranopterin monophosphate synthase MoaC [Planctomycetes bacterium]|nr:cyclic pyranopterin monophosphate synthase MoaC [Planctomycetota bacterium]
MPRKKRLTHLDKKGAARMVDVSAKKVTLRRAVASAEVRMKPATMALLRDGRLPKGDVLAVARIAGIQAAKQVSLLVPLCHPLSLESVAVDIIPAAPDRMRILVMATIRAKTGVEMEALAGAAAAALTLYDMCKAVDRGMEIGPIRLEHKSGGRSGMWSREKPQRPAARKKKR